VSLYVRYENWTGHQAKDPRIREKVILEKKSRLSLYDEKIMRMDQLFIQGRETLLEDIPIP
jgi:hypothetical protein